MQKFVAPKKMVDIYCTIVLIIKFFLCGIFFSHGLFAAHVMRMHKIR